MNEGITEAFFEAYREVSRQRDDDPNHRSVEDIIGAAFERHGLVLAPVATWNEYLSLARDADAPREPVDRLAIIREHRECGTPNGYDGCYAHWPFPHCRADGMTWPCDVARLATDAPFVQGKQVFTTPDYGADE